MIEPISLPRKTKSTTPSLVSRKKLLFTGKDGDSFSSDEDNNNAHVASDNKDNAPTLITPPNGGTTTPLTLSMSMIMRLNSSGSRRTTYFGELSFLDCQDKLSETFGSSPFLMNERPANSGPGGCMTYVRDYADTCMLDVFMAICWEEYVGAEDVGSKRKLMHEICKIISDLRQEYTVAGKRKLTETLDEWYAQYISIVEGLLDDATIWSITLYSSYFSALTASLKDKMEERAFLMPPLNNIHTKATQLDGICIIRVAAV